MEVILNTILTPLPAWLALVLIVVGAVSLVLGLIRLGYGAAVKTLVLDLIDQAEREIQFLFLHTLLFIQARRRAQGVVCQDVTHLPE